MTKSTKYGLLAALFFGLAAMVVVYDANATGYKKNPEAEAEAKATAASESHADAASEAASNSASEAAANSSNEGNSLNVEGDRVENNSSNVVLVPNNNTESCVRVFGLAFGKNGESGAVGFPWRSKACDYEQAADDAFAAGERELGWFWKCQNKNLYRTFKLDGMTNDEAKLECHKKAVGMNSALATIEDLERRLEAAEDLAEFRQSHKEVCEESLERCEQKAYGEK